MILKALLQILRDYAKAMEDAFALAKSKEGER